MAEVVVPARGRHGGEEREETAIAVMGALPQRQRGPEWLNWRGNHSEPSKQTRFDRDTKLILKLLQSGRVDERELYSYRTPLVILGQDDEIDPINEQILEIANDMAWTRRNVLYLKLERQSKSPQVKELEHKLAVWPAEVQQLQGQVKALGGRALRIPRLLVDPVELQN